MSSDDPSNVPAPSDRREAVREKAQRVQVRHARLRKLRIAGLSVLGIVVVAAIVTGVVLAISSKTSQPLLSPRNLDADGGIPITSVAGVDFSADAGSDPTATPTATTAPTPSPTSASTVDIRVYVDFLASGSQEFELANAEQIATWFTAGSATVTYYPVSMLTAKSNGTKYSLRAAASAACVATYSPDTAFAFTHSLLAQQPAVDSSGLSDSELADVADAAGVESADRVRSCIEDEDYVSWAKNVTDAALAGIPGTDGLKLTGTPLVLVNGQEYQGSLDDPKEFAQFVLTTASDSYYSGTASPTATP
ncbi:MAG: thioredoxin domain-containing protein [Microbacterium sp.]|uniref:DsbA family protein n=1 Tax=Microbacterium sp. TaxID=51671 RepID=UPI0039E3F3E2